MAATETSEELLLLRGTLEEAIAARFPAEWEPGPAGELEREAWAEATELGWDQVGLPEELGGFGAGVTALVELAEASGRHRLPLPLVETALARSAIAAAGWEQPEQGEAMTVGSARDGGARRLPWARHAGHAVLAEGERLLLVDLGAAGVEIVPGENLAGEPRDDVGFPAGAVLAAVADPELAGRFLERASLLRSAQVHGALLAALALTREHTASRKQFGRSLDRFQLVGAHIAEMAARVALVEALLGDAVRAHEEGVGATPRAALEVVAAEAATLVARSAHQCHGAIGVTGEYRLGHYSCRLWSWREELGDEFTARRELGAAALDPAGPDLWELSAPRELVA